MTGEETNIITENLINIEEDNTNLAMIKSLKNIKEELISKKDEIITGNEIYQLTSFNDAGSRTKDWMAETVNPMIRKEANVVSGQNNIIPFPGLIGPLPVLDTLSPAIGDMGTQLNTGLSNFVPFNEISQYTKETDGSSIGNAKTKRNSASHSSTDANNGNIAA